MNAPRLHKFLEERSGFFIFGVLFVSMLGGLAQIVPSLFDGELARPAENLRPLGALELAGREVYIRESCALCHTQQVRPFVAEVRRYGAHSRAEEFVYDRPFLWGSKRTGPDLHRVGGKYSDEWHRAHLINPRAVVPSSIMPAYPWLENTPADSGAVQSLLFALEKINGAREKGGALRAGEELRGKTEMDALIAYLQSLGKSAEGRRR